MSDGTYGAGFFYYVMELADDDVRRRDRNHPLFAAHPERAASGSSLPANECIRLGLLLTEALGALHANGLTHRDIKPSNIIFVKGVPKAGRHRPGRDDRQQSFVGTEGYVPPEGPGTAQADIYSLGKVLYEISMGKDRLDFPEVNTDLEARGDKEQLLELNDILLKTCATNPGKRYRSAEELHQDLVRLTNGEVVGRRRWPWFVGVLLLILLVAGGATFWKMRARWPQKPVGRQPRRSRPSPQGRWCYWAIG